MPEGSQAPWSYVLIRFLFKFVLKIFYGTIVVENTEFIPRNGQPCIVCANHSNALTDALLLVTAIPSNMRSMLRLTAKSTLFGKRNFTSWLIQSAGTIPIQRKKDLVGSVADNTAVMEKLMEALEMGDAICLFPEGISRYHPAVAPLKTGVARIVSDALTRNRDTPNFSISILTCSITYMQHFRSDVLVTFNPPMVFTVKNNPELLAPVEFAEIRSLTAQMHHQIGQRTIDSPSWDMIRSAKMAASIYVPLGTRMSLGDYVRVTRTFVEAFKTSANIHNGTDAGSDGEITESATEDKDLVKLHHDLMDYQDQLVRLGIKDDRVRRPLKRRTITRRIIIRFAWSLLLFSICMPGLALWAPIFATTFYAVHNFKKTGPIWNTWDEIAQYKLVYGLISGVCVWIGSAILTFPIFPVTLIVVPVMMWMSLRWFEDAVSAFRAFITLTRLLWASPKTIQRLRLTRENLHGRVMKLAAGTLGLPENPEVYFLESGGREKGRVRSRWESGARYFSLRRRRKRDWNEILRLYDQVDFPEEGQ